MGGRGRGAGNDEDEDATSAGSLSGRGDRAAPERRSALEDDLAGEGVQQVDDEEGEEEADGSASGDSDGPRRQPTRPAPSASSPADGGSKGSPGMHQLVPGRSARNSLMSALEADGGDRLASLRAVAAPPPKAAAAVRTPARVSLASRSGSQPEAPVSAPASSSLGPEAAGRDLGGRGKKFSSWTASPSRQGSAQGMHQTASSSDMGRLRGVRSRRHLLQEIGDPSSTAGGAARTARYIKPSKSVRMLSGVLQPGQITEFQRMRLTSDPSAAARGAAAPYSSGSDAGGGAVTPAARPSLAGAGPSSPAALGADTGKAAHHHRPGAGVGPDGKSISQGDRSRAGSETAVPLLGATRRRMSAKVAPASEAVPGAAAERGGSGDDRTVGFAPAPPGRLRRGAGRRAPGGRCGRCCGCGAGSDPTTFQSTWSLDDQAVQEESRQLEELRTRASVDSWHRRLAMELRRAWEFVTLPLNVVDLLAIVPFYIEAASSGAGGGLGLTVFRVLRLGRVFRIFKLGKSSATLQLMAKVMLASADALSIMIFFIAIGVVLFGALLWIAEGGEYDPETGTFLRLDEFGTGRERTPFESIPATAWFIIVTLTTLGYGDQVPNTTLGRFIAALLALVGILVLALPVTILGANFAYFYSQDEKEKEEAERERFRAEEGFEDDLSDVYSQAGALDEIDAGALGQPDAYDIDRDDPVLAAAAIGLHDDVPRWEQRKAAFFPVQPGGYVPVLRSFVYNPYVKDDTFADGIAEALAAEVDERIADLRGDAATRQRRAAGRARAERAAARREAAEASGVAGGDAGATPDGGAADDDEAAAVQASGSRVVRRRSAAATARKRRRRSSAAGPMAGMLGLRTLGGLGQKGPSVVGAEPGADGTAVAASPGAKQRRRLSAAAAIGGTQAPPQQGPGILPPPPDASDLVRAARRKARRGSLGEDGVSPRASLGFRGAAAAAMVVTRASRRPPPLLAGDSPDAPPADVADATAAAPAHASSGAPAHVGSSSAPLTGGGLPAPRVAPAWQHGPGQASRQPSHSRAITAVSAAAARERVRPGGGGSGGDAASEAGRGGKRDLYAKLTETRQRRDEWQRKGRFNRGASGGVGADASDDNASEDGGLQSVLGVHGARGSSAGGTPMAGSGPSGGAGMGVSWQLRQVVKQVTRAVRSDGTAEAVTAVCREQAEMREALERTQEGLRSALDEIRGLARAIQEGGAETGRTRHAPPLPPSPGSQAGGVPVERMAEQLKRQLTSSELRELMRSLEPEAE